MARCGCERKSLKDYYSVKGSILIKEEKNFVEEGEDEEVSDDDFDEFYAIKIFNKDGAFDRYWEDGIVYSTNEEAIYAFQDACDSIICCSEGETASVILSHSHKYGYDKVECRKFINGVPIDFMSKLERKQNKAIIDKLAE